MIDWFDAWFWPEPTSAVFARATRVWLIVSLAVSLLYGVLSARAAFSCSPGPACPGYIVADDSRQHVFWMERYRDARLFPHDIIADYFQSIEFPGTATFYHLFAVAGVDPVTLNRLIPGFLAVLTAAYGFGWCLRIFPVPGAAVVTTLIVQQSLWLHDDFSSGTSRAFGYPMFAAFLYYVAGRAPFGSLVSLALLTLFYPPLALVALGILVLR
jgi:hypothetical protein